MMILNPELRQYFSTDEDLFDQIMAVRGEVFREVKGRRTQRIFLGKRGYFLKQHFGVGWKEIFKNLVQCKWPIISAKNEWLAIQRLQQLGIATMQIAGYGYRGKHPAHLKSFILTEELTSSISLEDYCRDWHITAAPVELKRRLISAVAHIARTLHENGINHRDFYLCHFLLKKKNPNAFQLHLIDLHRACIRSHTPIRWIIKDLAGLYFSSKDIGLTSRDLLRFILEYRKQSLRDLLKNDNFFWQKVKKRGDELYRQHAKK